MLLKTFLLSFVLRKTFLFFFRAAKNIFVLICAAENNLVFSCAVKSILFLLCAIENIIVHFCAGDKYFCSAKNNIPHFLDNSFSKLCVSCLCWPTLLIWKRTKKLLKLVDLFMFVLLDIWKFRWMFIPWCNCVISEIKWRSTNVGSTQSFRHCSVLQQSGSRQQRGEHSDGSWYIMLQVWTLQLQIYYPKI